MLSKSVLTILAVFTVVAWYSVPTLAADDNPGYSLVLQTQPVGAGEVTYGTGVHRFGVGETVTLSAQPTQGYRFVQWIGPVNSAGSATTDLNMEIPTIVVAVFEKQEFEGLEGAGDVGSVQSYQSDSRTPGGLVASASVSGGSDRDAPDPDPNPNPEPTPEPVPEPATIMLLGLGSVLLRRRK